MLATSASLLPEATIAATEFAPVSPATTSFFSVATWPTSGSKAGSSGLETKAACARESRSMNSKSLAVSSVLAAIGTTPARMLPRNTTGHSGVSCMASSTRDSGAKPSRRSAEAKRCACSVSSP
ncbi:hypothetical protein D9M68_967270 [compost metagenome]